MKHLFDLIINKLSDANTYINNEGMFLDYGGKQFKLIEITRNEYNDKYECL